jgi:hypothetical protein
MKLAIGFLVVLATLSSVAQDKPPRPATPVLFDEFGSFTCEELLVRTDALFAKLSEQGNTYGYAVVSGGNARSRSRFQLAQMLRVARGIRGETENKFRIAPGKEQGELSIQLWLSPAPYQSGEFSGWNFSLPASTKPFVLTTGFGESMCAGRVDAGEIQEYFSANPGLRLNVVIFANNKRQRHLGLADAKKRLSSLPPSRIRYFFSTAPDYSEYVLEYWLVPRRR